MTGIAIRPLASIALILLMVFPVFERLRPVVGIVIIDSKMYFLPVHALCQRWICAELLLHRNSRTVDRARPPLRLMIKNCNQLGGSQHEDTFSLISFPPPPKPTPHLSLLSSHINTSPLRRKHRPLTLHHQTLGRGWWWCKFLNGSVHSNTVDNHENRTAGCCFTYFNNKQRGYNKI